MAGLLNIMWGRICSFASWPGRKGGIWVETKVAIVARIFRIWRQVAPVCQQNRRVVGEVCDQVIRKFWPR